MVSKKNRELRLKKCRDEEQRFAIRKLSVGVASVLIGLAFAYNGQNAHAATTDSSQSTVNVDATVAQPQNVSNAGNAAKTLVIQNTAPTSSSSNSNNDLASSNVQGEIVSPAKTVKPTVLAPQNLQAPVRTNLATVAAATTPAPAAPVQEETVKDQAGFIAALKKDGLSTIKISQDISLAGYTGDPTGIHVGNKQSHDITITSADGQKHKLDLNDNWLVDGFNVTFENLDLYDNTVKGLVKGAQSVTFNNVDFHGDTLINDTGNTSVNFKGTVNATTTSSYTIGDQTYKHTDYTLQDDKVVKGTNQTTNGDSLVSTGGSVNFEAGSTVNLSTVSGHVIQVHKSSTNPLGSVHVKQNANVVLNPHTMDTVSDTTKLGSNAIAYGVFDGGQADAGQGSSVLDVQGNLTINLKKAATDQKISGGVYGFGDHTNGNNTGIKISNGGKLDVEFDGTGVTIPNQADLNLYNTINSISIGDNSAFAVNAKGMGTYSGTLVSGTDFTIGHGAHVTITADGSGDIVGASGLTFTEPAEVNIDLTHNTGANSKALENGQIDLTYGRTKWKDGMEPAIAKGMSVAFGGDGTATISKLEVYSDTAPDTDYSKAYTKEVYVVSATDADDTKIVTKTISAPDTKTENLVGNITSSGGNEDIYVTVTVTKDATTTPAPGTPMTYHHYTITKGTAGADTPGASYIAKTDAKGDFTVNLSTLKDQIDKGATINITAMTMDGHKATATLTIADVKKEAKDKVQAEAEKVKSEIGKLTSLDDSARNQATTLVGTEVTAAEKEIDEAPLDGLQDSVKQFILQIDKDGANAAIDNAAAAVKKDVPDLTTSETNDLTTAVTTAKNNIKGVTVANLQDVATKQVEGILSIDKLGAKDAIEHTVAKAEEAITASQATDSDKTQAKAKVEKDKTDGEAKIQSANTSAAVKALKTQFIALIQTDSKVTAAPNHSADKAKAKQAVQAEADKANAEIGKMTALGKNVQQTYTNAVNDVVTKTNAEIEKLQDTDPDFETSLNTLQTQTILEIDKDEANAKIDNEVAAVEQAVDGLSPEEKNALESAATAAKNNIKTISSKDDLVKAQTEGILAVDKLGAKDAIEHAIIKAELAVNSGDGSESDKKAAIAKLETDKQNFESQIDQAQTEDAVNNLQTQGLAQIKTDSTVTPAPTNDLTEAKTAAKQAMQAEATKVKATFDSMANIDKGAASAKVDQDEKAAEQAIEAAADQAKIEEAKQNGLIAVDQDGANYAIDNEVAQVKKDTDSLSADEKQAVNAKIDQDVKNAKDSIKQATTQDAISSEQNKGILQIAKDGANAVIEHEVLQVETAIGNISGLNEDQIASAKQKVETDKKTIEDKINNAGTLDEVNKNRDEGIALLEKDKSVDTKSNNNSSDNGNPVTPTDNQNDSKNNGNSANINTGDTTHNQSTQGTTTTSVNENGIHNSGTVAQTTNSGNGQISLGPAGTNTKSTLTNPQVNAGTVVVDNKQSSKSVTTGRLPQTGDNTNETIGAIGLAIATAGLLFGIGGTTSKKRQK